jgi:purine-nucleoside/S-methyl-5'-thioadenosine phosphorylase / adenosine deaminase
VIRWEAPGPYAVAFSTRVGGVSEGPFASLNLGRLTADEEERVDENRRRLLREVGGEPDRLTMNRQVHSAIVRQARPGERGAPGDGLWTDAPALPLLALTADCMPIALARARGEHPGVAVLHAGWRGLLTGIVEAGAAALGGRQAAAIGPAIGPCCYEVGEQVAEPFRARFGADVIRDGRLDLWTAAERALRDAGVEDVERIDLCTACHPELFYSHRRDAGLTGRQGVVALVA